MRKLAITVALLMTVLLGFAGLIDSIQTEAQEHRSSEKGSDKTKSVPISGLLDVILQGPFVVERNADNITVLIPKVVNHTVPVLTDANFTQPRPLNGGDYSLTISSSTPGSAPINNPVAGTVLVQASGKSEGLNSDPGKKHYLSIKMPVPVEVVPWNADPIWVSSTPMPPYPSSIRGAVMLVLRYNYSTSTTLTFGGTEVDGTAIKYSLQGLPVGSEHVIAVVQGMKVDDVNDHPTAKDSFSKMKALEQNLTRYIDFPDLGHNPPARNQPLIINMVPQELTDFLTANGPASKAVAHGKDESFAEFRIQFHILLGHSDCRAPILYVDYTQ